MNAIKTDFVNQPAELASNFQEVGSSGLDAFSGYINEAYNKELVWPGVAPLYNRIWRSDPELAIVRLIFETWSGQQTVKASVQEEITGADLGEPTDDDYKAADFYQSVLDDLEGGINRWLSSCVTRVPFYGWGWWEVLPGVRDPGWRPPNGDPWRSDYADSLIGFRRFAFRRYSSFSRWFIDENTGRWTGLEQLDLPNPPVTIPLDRSLHVLFGDMDNPEGLATMETLWRLERYKWNLELIQGMGYEHSAGHSYFEATRKLQADDDALIRRAARAVATVQEGNYVSMPDGIKFSFVDVPFASGQNILEAIRYYSILKLAVWCMQWVSIATIADTGSYSAIKDASEMGINIYNSMSEGFVQQLDEQVGQRLFDYPANRAAFPGMTRRPTLSITPVRKSITLEELGRFAQAMNAVMTLLPDDWNAIRRESGLLPELTQEQIDEIEAEEDKQAQAEADAAKAAADAQAQGDEETVNESNELPDNVTITEKDVKAEMAFYLEGEVQKGVMVALYLPTEPMMDYALWEDRETLTLQDGALSPSEFHVTLAYLGDIADKAELKNRLMATVQVFAARTPAFDGVVNGYGRFTETHLPDKDALWLSLDSPALPTLRQNLIRTLELNGFKVSDDHGFTPHITRAYVDKNQMLADPDFKTSEVIQFASLFVAWGMEVYGFMLLGEKYAGDGADQAMLSFRPFIVSVNEQPVTLDHLGDISEKDVEAAMRRFGKWAKENEPELWSILNAKVLP